LLHRIQSVWTFTNLQYKFHAYDLFKCTCTNILRNFRQHYCCSKTFCHLVSMLKRINEKSITEKYSVGKSILLCFLLKIFITFLISIQEFELFQFSIVASLIWVPSQIFSYLIWKNDHDRRKVFEKETIKIISTFFIAVSEASFFTVSREHRERL
jgi:hypothetical protein